MAIPQRLHFLPLKVTAFVSHNYSYLQHYKLLSLAKAGKGGKEKSKGLLKINYLTFLIGLNDEQSAHTQGLKTTWPTSSPWKNIETCCMCGHGISRGLNQ